MESNDNVFWDYTIRIVQLLVQALVPITLFLLGRRITQAQYIKASLDAWNEYNKAVVANDANAKIAHASYGFGWAKDSPDAYREAHLVFMVLNALAIAQYGRLHGLVPREMFEENLHLFRAWLANDRVFELSQSRGYPKRFRKLCFQIHEGIAVPNVAKRDVWSAKLQVLLKLASLSCIWFAAFIVGAGISTKFGLSGLGLWFTKSMRISNEHFETVLFLGSLVLLLSTLTVVVLKWLRIRRVLTRNGMLGVLSLVVIPLLLLVLPILFR